MIRLFHRQFDRPPPLHLQVLALSDGLRHFGALYHRSSVRHDQPRYADGDAFLFGPETRGLPHEVLEAIPPAQRLRLPMRPDNRSLNLSNAVAVLVFEAWRQNGFAGAG